MTKCKIFSNYNSYTTECDMNEWLQEHPNALIEHMSISQGDHKNHIVCILYREVPTDYIPFQDYIKEP